MEFFSLSIALPLLAGATLLYFVGVGVYRLTLHPLAKCPGPFWRKLSQWPEAWSALKGNSHIDLHRLHQQYGDIVCISPNSLSFRTAGAVHDIYTDRKANVIKTRWTETARIISRHTNTHNIPDRQTHGPRRRLLAHAFSENTLKTSEEFILSRLRVWCDYLVEGNSNASEKTAGWAKDKDVGVWSTRLTLDVLGELCFGESFHAMETKDDTYPELILGSSKINTWVAYLPIRHILYPLLKQMELLAMFGSQTMKDKLELRANILRKVQKRFKVEEEMKDKDDSEKRKDFFHYLLRAQDPETGAKFTPPDLVGEGVLLVGAGMDTTSTAISAIFFYLSRNRRVLEKLSAEIHGAFSSVEEIRNGAKLSSLRYLRAVVDEGMRLAPPVPSLLSRKILPGGAEIDGVNYPEGTVVGVPTYALHHDERYFPYPFTFLPERWIPGSTETGREVTEAQVETMKLAYLPFSTGLRGCVGKNMAMMELLLVVARTIYLYDFRPAPGNHLGEGAPEKEPGRRDPAEFQTWDYFISDRQGPVLEFKRREVPPAEEVIREKS